MNVAFQKILKIHRQKKNSLTKEDKIDKILEILDSHSIKLDIIFELLSSDKGLNNAMQLMKKESQSV